MRWLVAIAVPWLLGCEAKMKTGTITIGGVKEDSRWKYLSKFGYDIGKGTYAVRLKAIRPLLAEEKEVMLDIYLDEKWEKIDTNGPACDKVEFRNTKHPVKLPLNAEWSHWINGTLSQKVRPHVWYFGLSDCGGEHLPTSTRIKYEFLALQESESHFSVEMDSVLIMHFIEVVVLILFSIYFTRQCHRFTQSAESLHAVVWALMTAALVLFVGKMLSLFHWWSYAENGFGVKGVDVLAEICVMISQVTMASLLITIAHGYTLLQNKIGELDVIVPISFMVSIIHVLLTGFGKITDDAAHKWHDNEGLVGWLIVFCRIALAVWFSLAFKWTWDAAAPRLRVFLMKFGTVSIVYFFSYPLLFFVTGFFAPYVRQKVSHFGQFFIHWFSLFWLARMFLERGEYFQVSTLNSSFLPGGGVSVLEKDD